MAAVRIESRDDPASCRATEALQRAAWGFSDRGVVPAEQIRAAVHNGGLLLLALRGDTPVGFCYAFVGVDDDGAPMLCSHMLAVLSQERSRGVGRRLKLAQREIARRRGFRRVVWTFDPLQARNAHLNLHRLGAHACRYHVDHYGPMDDDLNAGLPTDRLVADWPVTAPEPSVRTADARWLLDVDGVTAHGHPTPGVVGTPGAAALVAVPSHIDRMRADDAALVLRWRHALRDALMDAFEAGLVAVDLQTDVRPGAAAYVLGRRT